ncbi:MAG: AAA family ATPase [Lentisphaeria bacterium]|nr:AAA family ATPase [Lentisphaeria bacterium]
MPQEDLRGLLDRFVGAFRRAIERESRAAREQLGEAEFAVLAIEEAVPGGENSPWLYHARLAARPEKLLPDAPCRLRLDAQRADVTVLEVRDRVVTLAASHAVWTGARDIVLQTFPGFLYDRMREGLERVARADPESLKPAFAAFGLVPPALKAERLHLRHDRLNRSQGIALGNCLKSSCAFVWGPPGTGKTTTMARILLELLERGQRLLVASNTNAALDQVLRTLRKSPEAKTRVAPGQAVRLGSPDPEWEFLTPRSQAETRAAPALRRRQKALDVRTRARKRLQSCLALQEHLHRHPDQNQPGLLRDLSTPGDALPPALLLAAMGPGLEARLRPGGRAAMLGFLDRRLARLGALLQACEGVLTAAHASIEDACATVVRQARLVLATAAGVFTSRHLEGEFFDTVVIEEATMVVLPALFLCAARATARLLVVGDPMQLGAIVHARDAYTRRAMERDIFRVAAPNPFESPLVSMLEDQYRMHPHIGDLVSRLFYAGRLHHAVPEADLRHIVDAEPFRGHAVVLLDSAGKTRCSATEASFSRDNQGNADTVLGLVRRALDSGLRSIAIITPYAAQAKRIRGGLQRAGIGEDRVECRTVHRFQGNEKDMVILDTVDTDPLPPGVLLTRRGHAGQGANGLLNVALSRARGKLVILADADYFRLRAPRAPITRVLDACERHGIRLPLPQPTAQPGSDRELLPE